MPVANIASSKKDARRSAVRAVRNRSIRSAVKTKVTRFRRGAVEEAENLDELALTAVSALDRAASKGVVHPRNAARRKARLMKRLNEVAQPAEPAAKPAAKKGAGTRGSSTKAAGSKGAGTKAAATKSSGTKAPATKAPAKGQSTRGQKSTTSRKTNRS